MYRIEMQDERGLWCFHPERLEWVGAAAFGTEMSKEKADSLLDLATKKADRHEVFLYEL